MTKKMLADLLDKSASAVSQFESGKSGLDLETFVRLAMALNVPPSFFAQNELDVTQDFSACHFRVKQSIPQGLKKSAHRYAHGVVRMYAALEKQGIQFPNLHIGEWQQQNYASAEIESIALNLRSYWGLGLGPIHNILNLLESNGILVVLLDDIYADLDAFAFQSNGRHCVAVSHSRPASRIQFDLAHELAHIVLHADEDTLEPSKEREAQHFAGAFIAPADVFKEECPRRYGHGAFLELKTRWHFSMQAALYRARQLGVISEQSYRWGMVDLSSRNERTNEPGEFQKDRPLLLEQAFSIMNGEFSLDDLAEDVGLHSCEVERILKTQLIPEGILEPMRIQRLADHQPRVVRIAHT